MTLPELQERYLKTRSVDDFDCLYASVLELAKKIVSIKLKKARKWDIIELEGYALDACSTFMMQYIKHPAWKCKGFYARLELDVRYIMYNPRKRSNNMNFYENTVPLNGGELPDLIKEPPADILEVLEGDKDRKRILLLVYKAGYFKPLIKDLEAIKSIHWIKRNINGLKNLFDYTRVKHG